LAILARLIIESCQSEYDIGSRISTGGKGAVMTVIATVKMHFEDSGEWYSLPEWAEYFIRAVDHASWHFT